MINPEYCGRVIPPDSLAEERDLGHYANLGHYADLGSLCWYQSPCFFSTCNQGENQPPDSEPEMGKWPHSVNQGIKCRVL